MRCFESLFHFQPHRLCGFPPFFDEDGDMGKVYQKISTGTYTFPSPYFDLVSENAKDLIRHLFIVNPNDRYTAQQALRHVWISGRKDEDVQSLAARPLPAARGENFTKFVESIRSSRASYMSTDMMVDDLSKSINASLSISIDEMI